MKKLLLIILCFGLLTGTVAIKANATEETFSWYCKRATGNVQPPLPSEFCFINDYPTIWLDKTERKKIYLTFDCGYENGNTEAMLDALKKHNVKATFFVVGHYLESAPDMVKRMVLGSPN